MKNQHKPRLKADCGGPFDLTAAYTGSNWENNRTTLGEMAVQTYLMQNPAFFRGKTMLHVGIGNGSMLSRFGRELTQYIGLTISKPEIDKAARDYRDKPNATFVLGNKYDPRLYAAIPAKFDLIIDVALKTFACCETHFDSLIGFYKNRLGPMGRIITGEPGLRFGWAGNTKVAHTPGADTNPAIAATRALGTDGLQILAKKHRLTLANAHVKGIVHNYQTPDGQNAIADETIWILTR